jgi:oligosaccharide repeat unit polymerase
MISFLAVVILALVMWKDDLFRPAAVLSVFMFIAYGLGPFLLFYYPMGLSLNEKINILPSIPIYGMLALVFFYIGWKIVGENKVKGSKKIANFFLDEREKNIFLHIIVLHLLLAIFLMFRYYKLVGSFGLFISAQKRWTRAYGVGYYRTLLTLYPKFVWIGAIIFFRRKRSLFVKMAFILFFMLFIPFMITVLLGSRHIFLYVFLIALFFYHYRIKKLNFVKMLFLAFTFILLLTGTREYRMNKTVDVSVNKIIYAIIGGMADVDPFVNVLKDFKNDDLSYHPELVIQPAAFLVPRKVWPNKPKSFGGGGLIHDRYYSSGKRAPTDLGELYVYGGWVAIVVYYFFLGILFRILYNIFRNKDKYVPLILPIYVSLIVGLSLQRGTIINAIYMSIIPLFCILFFYLLLTKMFAVIFLKRN